MNRFHRTAQWLADRLLPAEPRAGLRTAHANDPPVVLLPGSLYLVGALADPWCAMLRCPCGCRETLHLDLLPEVRPRWDVRLSPAGRASLTPSVHRARGCRSHFFLREGRVDWCGSHGRAS